MERALLNGSRLKFRDDLSMDLYHIEDQKPLLPRLMLDLFLLHSFLEQTAFK